ncbi:MAG: TDT family transporter [Oscillospiraceae bacterium]|jgi:exfoliative toxin A/B|nr:TDT family transporter [Oscillospiraceae bacterium]
MKFIKSIPMATCGLSLALAALGNLLLPIPYGQTIRYICGFLSFIVLIIFLSKIIFDFPHAKEELKTPIPLSVLPTATMAIMLLCTYIRQYTGYFAISIWYVAVIVHICLILLFIKRFCFNFKLSTVFPSWFIVGVGLVTISVTAPVMGAVLIGQIAFYIGFAQYFIVLTLVLLRMTKVPIFPEPARKTIAIFTAPMSLLVVGYFNSFVSQEQMNETLVYFMLILAFLSYVYVSIMMFSLLKINFYPTYAAFTFPYVISATAFRLGANHIASRYGFDFLIHIADVTMWIAVIIVGFVIMHYIKYLRFWLKF